MSKSLLFATPSSKRFVELDRSPLIATPAPRPPGSASDTLPTDCTRSYGFRVRVGSMRTSCPVTVWLIVWVCTLTIAAGASVTSTVAVTPPTVIRMSKPTFDPTVTSATCCIAENPGASAVTVYLPGCKLVTAYVPALVDIVWRSNPVATDLTATFAFGITAPVGSKTVPVICPVSVCENPSCASPTSAKITKTTAIFSLFSENIHALLSESAKTFRWSIKMIARKLMQGWGSAIVFRNLQIRSQCTCLP